MDLKSIIEQKSKENLELIRSVRHHIHQNPELSFQEHETCKYVSGLLKEWGIPFTAPVAGTGVVALVEGQNPSSKVLALRADMDALPIQEANDVPYKSRKPGVMHACGHDVHTASLLGVVKILSSLREHFQGTVKFIFQPGEEKSPGGASLMIKEGALKNPDAAAIMGQHVMPLINTGKVGFRKGMYMASTDEIYITVKGKGGHGAFPHANIDPVLITAHIITALQQIVSRNARPTIPSVLSFGKVTANGAVNVIPNEVTIEGTFRTFDETWRADAKKKIRKMAEFVAEGMGGTAEVTIVDGYPFLVNDENLTTWARAEAEVYLGPENVEDLDLWMAGEDFAFYTHEIPGCFYRIGTRNEAMGITSSVHTPTFNIDEAALETGMGLMSWMAVRYLNSEI